MTTRRPPSLATRLARPLIAAVVLVWSLSTALVAWYVDRQIQHNFDVELVESAHRQLYPALLDVAHAADPAHPAYGALPVELGEVPGSDYVEPLLLQLRAPDGRVLLRSHGAPSAPFDVPLREGFHDSVEHRIYTLHASSEDLWLQLADPLAERAQARHRTLSGLIAVLLVMLPVLAWLIRWIARRELRSVQWLQQQIDARSGRNLQPLALDGLPRELHQVGGDVNLLMQRLHEALDVERALATNAAHELRTPLASVRLRLHTAVDRARGSGADSLPLTEVQAALDALATLSHRTERLLQLSRAESGSAALRLAPVDLVQLCATLAQEFWQQPRAQKRLDWDRPGAPVWVRGDIDTLAIALRNLVDNALTHSSGAVELAVQSDPPALVVRDAGPGVPPQHMARIRQRHVRASAASVGYGLGMSIVSSIAQRHQARLELDSPVPGRHCGLQARLVFAALPAGPGSDLKK